MQTNYIETFNHIKTPEPIKRHRQILSPYVAPGCKVMPFMPKQSKHSAADIKLTVIAAFKITVEQFESSSRKREYVNARKIFSYLVRQRLPLVSWKQIGRFMGGRDHSTAIHCKDAAQQHIDAKDHDFLYMLKSVEDMLSSGF